MDFEPPNSRRLTGPPSLPTDSFRPRIVRLGRTHCAVDYSMSNAAAVEVEGGYVLIDTGPGVTAATVIRAALGQHVRGELKAIIYTHSHLDHILGASVFHRAGVPIYAQERFLDEIRLQRKLATAHLDRGARQFGMALSDADGVSNGIGPPLRIDPGPVPPLLLPTHVFRDALDLEIGGVRFELRAAPGETHDHLFVWLPQDRTLIAGDNLYKAFPNLSAIRGSTPRPVEDWVRSLDRMRYLNPRPEHLILGHTDPVSGADTVRDLLTSYRDGIAFVHDSVVRLINQGLTPVEMVRTIRLPDHLRTHPYLTEVYGTLSASIRGIYSGYLGWFDGNASNLDPLSPDELGERLLPRLGGRVGAVKLIESALTAGDPRWAAWLSDLLLADNPNDPDARRLKRQALLVLAGSAVNPLFRNWYLHDAALLNQAPRAAEKAKIDLRTIEPVPVEEILAQYPFRVRPDRSASLVLSVGFVFTDSGKEFTFLIRRGVGEVIASLIGSPDLIIRATEMDFKRAFVIRSMSPYSLEFWRRIRFESAGSLLAPFHVLRRLMQLDACMIGL
jgi:alkyl sulfatase BDS1-like metallo-beta-lactamase superfamily hydrolase